MDLTGPVELQSRPPLEIETNFSNTTKNRIQSPLISFNQNPAGGMGIYSRYTGYTVGMRDKISVLGIK